RTSADKPSTRSASPKAAGSVPPRNWPAVARHKPNVTVRPPTMVASRNLLGPFRLPTAAVVSGTANIQTSRFTLALKLGETAHVHGLESVDDAMDENAEQKHRQHHVEGNPQLHHQRHPRRHADSHQKH